MDAEQALKAIQDLVDEIVRLPKHEKSPPQADPRLGFDDDEEEINPEKVNSLIEEARSGDATAEATLQFLVEDAMRGGRIDESLYPYILERTKKGLPNRRRGTRKTENFGRDWLLYVAVTKLGEFGYRPTRSQAKKTESASSLLKKALDARQYGERAIEDAWKRMDRLRHPSR